MVSCAGWVYPLMMVADCLVDKSYLFLCLFVVCIFFLLLGGLIINIGNVTFTLINTLYVRERIHSKLWIMKCLAQPLAATYFFCLQQRQHCPSLFTCAFLFSIYTILCNCWREKKQGSEQHASFSLSTDDVRRCRHLGRVKCNSSKKRRIWTTGLILEGSFVALYIPVVNSLWKDYYAFQFPLSDNPPLWHRTYIPWYKTCTRYSSVI